jgi:hypothetical protein
MKNRLSDGGL